MKQKKVISKKDLKRLINVWKINIEKAYKIIKTFFGSRKNSRTEVINLDQYYQENIEQH